MIAEKFPELRKVISELTTDRKSGLPVRHCGSSIELSTESSFLSS